MFVENAYLTESLFILLMKSCTTRTKRNDLNPSNIVKLSRRLESQPWIYDVPLSSLLYDDTKYQRQYHHMETSRETTRVYHDAIRRWISPQKPASNQQLIHMLIYLGLIRRWDSIMPLQRERHIYSPSSYIHQMLAGLIMTLSQPHLGLSSRLPLLAIGLSKPFVFFLKAEQEPESTTLDVKFYGINLRACSLRSFCSISLHIKNFLGPFLLGRRKYKYIIATILHEQDQQIKWTRTNQTPDSPIEFPVTKFSNHEIKDSVNCVSNKRGTDALAKYTDSLERKVALYIGKGKMHWTFDD